MSTLDAALSDAKEHVRKMVCVCVQDPSRVEELAGAIDALNTAWDKLTDRLVDQRHERDEEISRLLNLLAERRRR